MVNLNTQVSRESREVNYVDAIGLGDLDDVEMIEAVEESFGMKFEQAELQDIGTVGDLYDLIVRRMPSDSWHRGCCLSAVAYYKLRSAVRSKTPDVQLKPETPISSFASAWNRGAYWNHLEAQTGLRLPPLLNFWIVISLLVVLFATPIAWSSLSWKVGLSVLAVGLAVIGLSMNRFLYLPPVTKTLGDLARAVAALNIERLSRQHQSLRPTDVWSALVLIIRDQLAVSGSIGPGTKFRAP